MTGQEQQRPTVWVLATGGADDLVRAVCAGLEEEGAPVAVDYVSPSVGTAHDLAILAAARSRLDVGVGVTDREIVLTHARLPAAKPLLRADNHRRLDACQVRVDARQVGHNAGRLVTQLPLRLNTPPTNGTPPMKGTRRWTG